MADNDMAIGRVIYKLSHSKWWPEMLIIKTEDDAQDRWESLKESPEIDNEDDFRVSHSEQAGNQ